MDSQLSEIADEFGDGKESYARVRVGRRDWALVDEDMLAWVRQHRWFRKEGYAARYDEEGKEHRMHRDIVSAPPSRKVWHRNGNLLDNRRANLFVTNNFNEFNRARRQGKEVH